MISKFNTGFYQNGSLITKRSLIAQNYFKTWFFLDFLASFPYFYFFSFIGIDHEWPNQVDLFSIQSISLFQLFRIIRIFRFQVYIYQFQDSISSPPIVMMIQSFNFLLIAFLLVHWFACAQHLVYFMKDDSTVEFSEHTLQERYVLFLYWSVMTMTSVGYGSDLGTSNNELILSILAMLITSIIFGNMTGGIQNVLLKYYATDRYFKYMITDARIYKKKKDIPQYLFTRMYEYIRQLKQIKKQELLEESLVLEGLSQPINEEIFHHTRVFVLERSTIFSDYRNSFLRSLGNYLQMNVNAPDDVIFHQNKPSDKMYFITEGSVNIYHQQTGTIYRELGKGRNFGEIGFFLDKKRTASAQCTKFSQIFSLDRFLFYQFLQTKPKQKEMTQLMVRTCLQYNLQVLNVKCYLCSSPAHIAKDCVKFVFIVNKGAIARAAKDRRYKVGKPINPFQTPIQEKSIKNDQIRMRCVNHLHIPHEFKAIRQLYPHKISLLMKIRKFQHSKRRMRFQSEKLEQASEKVSEQIEQENSSDEDSFINKQLTTSKPNNQTISISVEDFS